jgi:type IV pilus assembly protein PilO
MAKSSSGQGARGPRDPKPIARAVLGVLVGANLIAAGLVLFPPGGSTESLQRQASALQTQVAANQQLLDRTRQHLASVEKARDSGNGFLSGYFLSSRTAYATLLSELSDAEARSKIKPRDFSYSTEPIDGSDNLSMLTITANFDGVYRDVLSFVHELDRSPRLMIIESLTAAPQQGSNTLSVSMKIDTFVRDEGGPPASAPSAEAKTVADSRSPVQ